MYTICIVLGVDILTSPKQVRESRSVILRKTVPAPLLECAIVYFLIVVHNYSVFSFPSSKPKKEEKSAYRNDKTDRHLNQWSLFLTLSALLLLFSSLSLCHFLRFHVM